MAKCYKFKTMLKTRCLKGGEGRGNEPPSLKNLARKAVNFSREVFLTSSFTFSKLVFELGSGVPFHVFNARDSVEGLTRFVVFRILEQLKFSAGKFSIFCRPSQVI